MFGFLHTLDKCVYTSLVYTTRRANESLGNTLNTAIKRAAFWEGAPHYAGPASRP